MAKTVAIYTRISQADAETQTATHRQEAACRALAAARDWDVAQIFEDVDVSAYSGVERPAFNELLEEVEAGALDGLVCWKLDRLCRRAKDFERLWDLCEKTNTSIASVTEPIDSSTELGLAVIRVIMTFAQLESATKGERLRAKYEEMARAGAPPLSRRAYGFNREWTDVVPEEAAIIREAARRIAACASPTDIANDFNRRGLHTMHGGVWTGAHITQMVQYPHLIGERRYRGEVVAQGQWPPVLDRATYDAVQMVLRGRELQPRAKRHHLLAGTLRCGYCGGRLTGTVTSTSSRSGRRTWDGYRCRPWPYGCQQVNVSKGHVEEWIIDATLGHLDDPEFRRSVEREVTAAVDQRPEVRELRDDLRRLAEEFYRDNTIDRAQYGSLRRILADRLQRAEARVQRRFALNALVQFAGRGHELRESWDELAFEQRRAVIEATIERVEVAHPNQRGNMFDPSRLTIVWRLPVGATSAGQRPAIVRPRREWILRTEAQAQLGVSRHVLGVLVRNGDLPVHDVNGKMRVFQADVDALVAKLKSLPPSLTVPQMAERLGVPSTTPYAWIYSGMLRAHRVRGLLHVYQDDLDGLIAHRRAVGLMTWRDVVRASGKARSMSDPSDHSEDPIDIEPTNNSSGDPVDLNKVEEIEDEARE